MTNAKNNIRIAAATPVNMIAVGALAVGEVAAKVARGIAGKNYDRVIGSGYVSRRVQGVVFEKPDFKDMIAKADAKTKEKAGHSDMVEWKKGRWVPSKKAEEQAKANGHESAFLPQMYKAANWIIRCAREGADKAYTSQNGVCRTYGGWVFQSILGHAKFMEAKGVKEALAPEKMVEYFLTACKHSRVAEDKLPNWKDICELVKMEAKAGKVEEKAEAVTAAVDEPADDEPRDGRAPKKSAGVNELVHGLGFIRLNKGNAHEVAEKAANALSEGNLTQIEANAVLEACISKNGGEEEELRALFA